jgi:prevent-host-death family protein
LVKDVPSPATIGGIPDGPFTVNGMKQLNLVEAKARLSHLVDQAAKGRGVIIAKSGVPMAKLVPLDEGEPRKFKFGTLKGVLSEELVAAIEAPLPDDVLESMLDEPISSGESG